MFSLQIVKEPQFTVSENILDEIWLCISKLIEKKQLWVINLVFFDAWGIQNLNKKYRKINKVTDVLSFHYYESFCHLWETDLAGEIIFCEERIISQGKEYGLWTEKEFYKLLIHSLLHILGYDHETDEEYEEMIQWEKKVWKEIFWEDIVF